MSTCLKLGETRHLFLNDAFYSYCVEPFNVLPEQRRRCRRYAVRLIRYMNANPDSESCFNRCVFFGTLKQCRAYCIEKFETKGGDEHGFRNY